MNSTIMGLVSGLVAAFITSGVLAWALPGVKSDLIRRNAGGIAVCAGMAGSVLAAILAGQSIGLVTWFAVFALVAGAATAFLESHWVHVAFRLAAVFLLLALSMWFLYWRGDVHAVPAGISAVIGTVVVTFWSFATRACPSPDLRRLPPLAFLLGGTYLFWIASGLPNPGLMMLALFSIAAVLPLAFFPPVVDAALLGPILGALAWVSGFYAWLGNASPVMVLAPAVIIVADVAWTLIRRIVTPMGRAGSPESDGLWHSIDAWTLPAGDLVGQRLLRVWPPRVLAAVFLAVLGACLAVGILGWRLHLGMTLAGAPLVIIGLGWIALPELLGRAKRQAAPKRASAPIHQG